MQRAAERTKPWVGSLDKSTTVGQTMRWVTQPDILNCIPKCDRSCTYIHTWYIQTI